MASIRDIVYREYTSGNQWNCILENIRRIFKQNFQNLYFYNAIFLKFNKPSQLHSTSSMPKSWKMYLYRYWQNRLLVLAKSSTIMVLANSSTGIGKPYKATLCLALYTRTGVAQKTTKIGVNFAGRFFRSLSLHDYNINQMPDQRPFF